MSQPGLRAQVLAGHCIPHMDRWLDSIQTHLVSDRKAPSSVAVALGGRRLRQRQLGTPRAQSAWPVPRSGAISSCRKSPTWLLSVPSRLFQKAGIGTGSVFLGCTLPGPGRGSTVDSAKLGSEASSSGDKSGLMTWLQASHGHRVRTDDPVGHLCLGEWERSKELGSRNEETHWANTGEWGWLPSWHSRIPSS